MATPKKAIDVATLAADYASLKSLRKLATKHGVSVNLVKRRLKEIGVKIANKGPREGSRLRKDGLRKCGGVCQQTLPLDQFFQDKSDPHGRGYMCRPCQRDYINARRIVQTYGISLTEFNEMLVKQGGGCAICGQSEGQKRNGKTCRLHVDHCHKTGKVRGILCGECNTGLGKFKDEPGRLRMAIAYLERNSQGGQ